VCCLPSLLQPRCSHTQTRRVTLLHHIS
jgi:hypothetical protein